MFYTVNLKLHSLHTVKENSNTHIKLIESKAKFIKIGQDKHKVFTSSDKAKTFKEILMLTSGAE